DLARQADAERDRLLALLGDACDQIAPGEPVAVTVAILLADHPDAAGVLAEARELTAEVIAWTRDLDLVPYHDGECRVGPAPGSRQFTMAMMSWAAPYEPPGPSWYYVTPPSPEWSDEAQREWLQVFSRSTLPAITVHEVAPGHYSHGLALRRTGTDVRRTLQSEAFIEGWAHYVEELALVEGFRSDDPRYQFGVAGEALVGGGRRGAGRGAPAGVLDRPADGGDGGAGGGPPVRGGRLPGRPGGAGRGPPGHLRPDLRPVHLGQAGDPPAARGGPEDLG